MTHRRPPRSRSGPAGAPRLIYASAAHEGERIGGRRDTERIDHHQQHHGGFDEVDDVLAERARPHGIHGYLVDIHNMDARRSAVSSACAVFFPILPHFFALHCRRLVIRLGASQTRQSRGARVCAPGQSCWKSCRLVWVLAQSGEPLGTVADVMIFSACGAKKPMEVRNEVRCTAGVNRVCGNCPGHCSGCERARSGFIDIEAPRVAVS